MANVLWKQEYLLKKIPDGQVYLEHFYGLINSGKITVVYPNKNLMQESYTVAKSNDVAIYDAIFICLAVQLNVELKTLDKKQAIVYEKIKVKRHG